MTLQQAERTYFVRKLGGTQAPTKPLNQIKREYFIAQTGVAVPVIRLHELELRWLRKVITDAGGTISDSSEGTLWKQMVSELGLTPSPYIQANKLTFFLNAA